LAFEKSTRCDKITLISSETNIDETYSKWGRGCCADANGKTLSALERLKEDNVRRMACGSWLDATVFSQNDIRGIDCPDCSDGGT
ncbi:hypothetical protein RvY_08507, partial [Ramazzottius varieornatus]